MKDPAPFLLIPLNESAATIDTEVVVHVRGAGNTLDDGMPLPNSVVADLLPTAFISALVHDAEGNPIDATNRRRHPNRRQKRLIKERDNTCVDCGRHQLLEYDHVPAFEETGHTITTELRIRCAPCHHNRPHPNSAPAIVRHKRRSRFERSSLSTQPWLRSVLGPKHTLRNGYVESWMPRNNV